MRRLLFAAFLALVISEPAHAELWACQRVPDPSEIVAAAKDALRSGMIQGYTFEGERAKAFGRDAGFDAVPSGVLVVIRPGGYEIGAMFGDIVCRGEPNPKMIRAIRKHTAV